MKPLLLLLLLLAGCSKQLPPTDVSVYAQVERSVGEPTEMSLSVGVELTITVGSEPNYPKKP